jgi:hypothetical protein
VTRHQSEGNENGEAFKFVKKVGIVSAAVISICTAVTLANKVLIADPIGRALLPITQTLQAQSYRIDEVDRKRQAGDSLLLARFQDLADQQQRVVRRIDLARRGISRVQDQADTLIRAQVRKRR